MARARREVPRGVGLGAVEAEGGVGGRAGMKKEGRAATVDCVGC